MAIHQEQWAMSENAMRREETLKKVNTADVIESEKVHRINTATIKDAMKSSDEVVEEMRTWLRTGISPDGTRMMTDENSQWHLDFYQYTAKTDVDNESLPADSQVDYYYWNAPYLAHIGDMKLVMMHSQVNLRDGTHMPCDRLRVNFMNSKNIDMLAEKRLEIQERDRETLLKRAMSHNRGHPLRKDGLYTKYFWRPFHQDTIDRKLDEFEARKAQSKAEEYQAKLEALEARRANEQNAQIKQQLEVLESKIGTAEVENTLKEQGELPAQSEAPAQEEAAAPESDQEPVQEHEQMPEA